MVTGCEWALGYEHVVMYSEVCENYVRCRGGVVCKVSGEVRVDMLQCSVLYESV